MGAGLLGPGARDRRSGRRVGAGGGGRFRERAPESHREPGARLFQLRSLDAELALLNQTIDAYQRARTLTENQYNGGLVARSDLGQADAQLEAARAAAIDTELLRAQEEHAMAALVGAVPSAFAVPTLPLEGDPPVVPPELPSRLLERRPDIAAAERRVAAANARIGSHQRHSFRRSP